MCLQEEWGERPRESVTVMPVYQDKSDLPRAALCPAMTGAEAYSTSEQMGLRFRAAIAGCAVFCLYARFAPA